MLRVSSGAPKQAGICKGEGEGRMSDDRVRMSIYEDLTLKWLLGREQMIGHCCFVVVVVVWLFVLSVCKGGLRRGEMMGGLGRGQVCFACTILGCCCCYLFCLLGRDKVTIRLLLPFFVSLFCLLGRETNQFWAAAAIILFC